MAWFARTTRHLDRVLIWIGAIGTVWAAMTWVASQLEALGNIGWAEHVFLGLFAAALLVFMLSVGLIAWRIFRPLQPRNLPVNDSAKPTSGGTDLADVSWEFLESNVASLKTEMAGIKTRIAELGQQIDGVKVVAEAGTKEVGDVLKLRFDQISEGFDALSRSTREWFANVDAGFLAISHLESSKRMADELVSKGEELLAQADAVASPQATARWLDSVDSWRVDLDQWLIIAESYAPGTAENVRSTNADFTLLKHNTNLNGGGVRAFQDLAVQLGGLQEVRGRVERQMFRAAFHKPSKRGAGIDYGPSTD